MSRPRARPRELGRVPRLRGGQRSGRVAVRELADKCEHRLFLSATPHNGYSESFTALLEMIDPRGSSAARAWTSARCGTSRSAGSRRDLREVKGFAERQLKTLPFTAESEDEADECSRCSTSILTESARRNGQGHSRGGIVAMLLKKRFLSSPWSFARTVRRTPRPTRIRGLEVDDEDQYYQEVLGSGQSDEEEGDTEQPEVHRPAAEPSAPTRSAADGPARSRPR